MVSKKVVLLSMILFDIAWILGWLIKDGNRFLYSTFIFNGNAFLVNILVLFLANALAGLIWFVCRKNVFRKIFIFVPTCAVSIWALVVAFSLIFVGVFWQSETDDYTEFNGVDAYLDSRIEIAGLKINEIITQDIESVEGFYYSYNSTIVGDHFIFKGEFRLGEKRYSDLKRAFSDAQEFQEKIYSEEIQDELQMTGFFEYDETFPYSPGSTSADLWKVLVVRFSDEDHSFYFEFEGDYDT